MGNNVMATGASRSAGIFRALSDRKISTKIALGFACVLTILAIVSGIAYVSLTKTSAAFQAYGQRVAMVGLVREIDRSFLSFRRFVREYALSGEESAAEEAQRQRQLVAKSIDAAQKAIKNPERLAKIKDLASYFEIYAKDFDKLRAMRIEQSKLASEVMDPTGIKLRAQIEQLHSWAIARANGNNASNLTGDAIKQLMLVRLYANRLLDRRDSAAAQTVDKAFADLKQVMAAVDTTVAGDDFRRVVTDVNTDVEKYAGAFKKAAHDAQMIEILIDGEMSDAAKRISDDAAEIVRSGVAEEQAIEHETENLLLSIEWLLTALAIGGLMLGGILSWVIGRGISRPVQAMTQTMAALANGDLTVDVPAQDKKDEVGEMAKAVLVFRDAAIEKVRMEREVEEERIRSEEARRKAEEEAIGRERSMVSQSIGAGMTKLAAKDLTYRLVDDLPEAYRKLQSDFNFAMDELEKAIAGVRLETDGMKSGTSEIAQASADLSQRTESQAASLEETAAAVEQITATVNKTAEGAGHARQIVLTAKTDAERSGEIVGKAIDAMSAIEKSSRQVSQIIGVIDEIAFQTNLLALNAGVEAARAGDAGRGFAVVASEVRALAQRSADAAKQIKDLISASTVQVDKGVELVGESGKALERIVAGVTEINTVVSEIAAGAEEQATGLKQVNTAVNQMDQVTQQNAAMVEEATAASRTLAQQSDALAEMVSTFRISDIASADPLRNELRKVAPHAFSSPRGHSNSPSRAISNRSLASASRQKQKPMVARASASAATAATSNDGWDEF